MGFASRIMVAPNGARRQKADHPALPLTPDDLAATAKSCFGEGADAIHLHVREDDGSHSLDAGRYREAIAAVAGAAPEMAIQITTEAAGIFDVPAQLACLEALRPAAASVSVREMARDPQLAARAYALADEAGTVVQHILYAPACIEQFKSWRYEGVIRAGQDDVIFVLGQYTPPVLAQPSDLDAFLAATRGMGLRWTVCAFGRHEHACLLEALRRGGSARAGFENNIHTPEGKLLPGNTASVRALLKAARAENLVPARPAA